MLARHARSSRGSGIRWFSRNWSSNENKLGRADSHGCIRMQQANADKVWQMFHGTGKPGTSSPLWSEAVPRYFQSTPSGSYTARRGYVRDGSFLTDAETGARLTKPGYSVLFVFFRDDL